MVTPAALAFSTICFAVSSAGWSKMKASLSVGIFFVGRVVGHEIAHPLCGERILRVGHLERREFTGRREDGKVFDIVQRAAWVQWRDYLLPLRLPVFL